MNVTVLNSWGRLAPIEGAQVVVGGSNSEDRMTAVTDAAVSDLERSELVRAADSDGVQGAAIERSLVMSTG